MGLRESGIDNNSGYSDTSDENKHTEGNEESKLDMGIHPCKRIDGIQKWLQ